MKDFFKKGENIFHEGDTGNEMYVIKSGKVEVIKKTGKEEIVLATLDAKVFFGEMALFGDPHRSATIRAAEDTKMIVITREILDSQLKNVPEWFVSILKTLVGRLRATNKRIKSRFAIGLDFSLLKVIVFLDKVAKEDGENELSLKKAQIDCCNVLGISEEEFKRKLKTLMFVGMVRFSEPKDRLIIPDEDKLKDFIVFMRNKSGKDEQDEEEVDFGGGDDTAKFEKIFKLISHQKM